MSFTFTVTVPGGVGGGTANATFGALTRAGAGGVALPAGATSITGGTATGYSVVSGFVSPTSDGSATAGTIIFNNGTTWTVSVAPDTYSCRNLAQMTAAFTAMGSVGKIVSLRPGNYGLVDYPASNVTFSPRAQLIGEGSWALATGVLFQDLIYNSKNLTISNIEIFHPGTVAPFDIGGSFADGLIIEDCWIHGTYHDPLQDWSNGWVGNSIGNTFPCVTSLVIRRNFISDIANAINVSICDGPITVEDNLITRFRSDAIHIGLTSSTQSKTCAKNFNRNVIYAPIYDVLSHSDCLQFVSSGLSMTDDYTGIVIRQNVMFTSDLLSMNLDMQCLVCFQDGTLYGMRIKDCIVAGNVMVHAITHSCTFSHLNGGLFVNNTCLRYKSNAVAAGGSPALNLGDQKADGTIIVHNNVVEAMVKGGGAGTGTFNDARNIIVGGGGATIPYANVINNATPTVAVSSYADVLARYGIKVGGPADLVSPKAGALGSGYGVYGTPRVPAEWSYNPAFEV